MPIELAFILIIFLIILILFYYKFTILPNRKSRKFKNTRQNKKYYTPKNNYFRNNQEHIDMTDNYVDNLWNEINK